MGDDEYDFNEKKNGCPIANTLPKGKVKVIQNAGHFIMIKRRTVNKKNAGLF